MEKKEVGGWAQLTPGSRQLTAAKAMNALPLSTVKWTLFNFMKTLIRISISLFFATALVFLCGCSAQKRAPDLHTIEGSTMGTTFTVKLVKDNRSDVQINYDEIEPEINKLLVKVNQQMSTYIRDSEISRFNQYEKSDWFPVSGDLVKVLNASISISEKSNGAFDITVGPLVNLWGFGPKGMVNSVPDEKDIEEKKAVIGYKKIAGRNSPSAVKKQLPEIYCDLSAIAKGFGVDKVASLLESLKIENYMVEIGGEVRTKGKTNQGNLWRIGVETPDHTYGIQKVIKISDNSMATSGDYKNYFEKDGIRYSHTIDPRTGKPITHKLASVTVIHESCMIADAMATAINVLGPEAGYDFARREELSIFMLVREEQGFVEKMTPEFKKFLSNECL